MNRLEDVTAYSIETLLAAAQRTLDRHVVSGIDGRCVTCGVPGPCGHREMAVAVFSRYHRWGVPRRTPGASLPGVR